MYAQHILSARKIRDTVFTQIVRYGQTGLLKPGTPLHYVRGPPADLCAHHRIALIVEYLAKSDGLRDEFRLDIVNRRTGNQRQTPKWAARSRVGCVLEKSGASDLQHFRGEPMLESDQLPELSVMVE